MKLLHITLLSAISMSGAYAASAPVEGKEATELTTRLNKLQVVVSNLQKKVDLHIEAGKTPVKAAVKVKTVKVKAVTVKTAKKIIAKAKKVVAMPKNIKDTYRSAYFNLRKGKVDAAITGFNQIVKNYPKSSLSDNSQYWLGEAYLLKKQKEKAMEEFDKVVANYPDSDKVPGALLKLGLVQLSLNNRPKAKEYLDYIIIHYPKTRAAKIASKRAGKAKL
ncbi:MAG: tol-pal system protein YbgF [Methylococcales bacterium]|nr:tol-pal system protein YbgF [Methylococcales bacterium]